MLHGIIDSSLVHMYACSYRAIATQCRRVDESQHARLQVMTSLHALMIQLPLLAMQQKITNETQQSIATLSNGVFRGAKGPVLSPQEIQKDGCHVLL